MKKGGNEEFTRIYNNEMKNLNDFENEPDVLKTDMGISRVRKRW